MAHAHFLNPWLNKILLHLAVGTLVLQTVPETNDIERRAKFAEYMKCKSDRGTHNMAKKGAGIHWFLLIIHSLHLQCVCSPPWTNFPQEVDIRTSQYRHVSEARITIPLTIAIGATTDFENPRVGAK